MKDASCFAGPNSAAREQGGFKVYPKGPAGWKEWMDFLGGEFDFVAMDTKNIAGPAPDIVLVYVTAHVKHKTTGKAWQGSGIHEWKVRDGKVCSCRFMCSGNGAEWDATLK